MLKKLCIALIASSVIALAACGDSDSEGEVLYPDLEGKVKIDGSSTVLPISAAAAELFHAAAPKIIVPVAKSGTGGGFKKFVKGETDINDASRPIKAKEEQLCEDHNIGFIELPIAFDGLSVVANKKNPFIDHLTVAELKRIWEPGSSVKTWKDVRSSWPDENIKLYGPGADSGTFDYFTEAIMGKSGRSRSDFTASEDDNVLVTGIAGDEYALGYFGYSYYDANKTKLKVVPIDGGNGPVAPTAKTINNGTYAPLSRPLFIYVSTTSAERKDVQAFVKFYIQNAPKLVESAAYVSLGDAAYKLILERFEKKITGSVFRTAKPGAKIEEVLRPSN